MRRKLRARTFAEINGEQKLLYEIDESGTVKWHVAKETIEALRAQMLNNIGVNMSRFYSAKYA